MRKLIYLLIPFGFVISVFHWVGFILAFAGIGLAAEKLLKAISISLIAFAAISAIFLASLPPWVRFSEVAAIPLILLLILSILSAFFGSSLRELRKS
ncbi:hypothetical protein Ferp_1644 [Ferroglobus placidus DSM 10642]|uniref:Uncharacterized protein n=1 Tax=Ferroglobus placidus (strain DSM 10642 / AEDII12DO) TaxID=589924 RepID=D3RZ79_FERPA|nr:hypothetical protein [Ferroglobus placidus]ADC65792.1 hypothetical protein Ferp_1644 [Ferroglobus placidus DSM 10642]